MMETRSKRKRAKSSNNQKRQDFIQPLESDTERLLAVFPIEIWSLILKNVDKVEDFYKIRKASQLFNDVISKHRIQILFPSVLKVMMERCICLERDDLLVPDTDKWLNELDFFPLRQVCRTWKKTIHAVLLRRIEMWLEVQKILDPPE